MTLLLIALLAMCVFASISTISAIATGIRSTMCNAAVDAIDAGSTDANGEARFYTASHAALVVSVPLENPAFGAASSGVATVQNTGSGLVGTVGTGAGGTIGADGGRIVDRNNATCWEFTCGTSATEAVLSSLVLADADTLTLNTFTVTMPAS